MDLQTFIGDPDRRRALADRLGKSADYLWQIGTGWNGRKPSPELALGIDRATAEMGPEAVPCESLRPDVVWTRDAAGEVTGYHVPLNGEVAPSDRAA